MKKVNQSTPKSTIIIPCYNEASGIRKTLRSVFNNLSNRNFEVIVVNDGSDDKSTEILSEFALEQPIKIIENKSNSGYGYSLKKGFWHQIVMLLLSRMQTELILSKIFHYYLMN